MDTSIYNDINYYTMYPTGAEQIAWEYDQIKYGDQLAAISYALGFTSFYQFKNLFEFDGIGRGIEPRIGAQAQITLLWENRKRTPLSVLEIGGGRGEICVGLSSLGIKCQMVEPSQACSILLRNTQEKFGMFEPITLYNLPLDAATNFIQWDIDTIDTLILCETIEHIEAEEFDRIYDNYIKPILKSNNGCLIITNWIDNHPIELWMPYHCRVIDDKLYDKFCEDGEKIYREGSHLVIKY